MSNTAEDTVDINFKSDMEEIQIALRSNTIVWVRTPEEARFIEHFLAETDTSKHTVMAWSLWQGLVPGSEYNSGVRATGDMNKTWQPAVALDKIKEVKNNSPDKRGFNYIIMRDPMAILQEPVPRALRDAFDLLKANRTKILFLSPFLGHGAGGKESGLPPTLDKQAVVLDYNLPGLQEVEKQIKEIIRKTVRAQKPPAKASEEVKARTKKFLDNNKYTDDQYHEFARALQGLTQIEVRAAVTASLAHCKCLNTQFLLNAKKAVINKDGILEFIDTTSKMSDVGGLDLAKEFFEDYADAHTAEAQEFGVEPLKGVLLVGIPGCGKSLISKAISSSWHLPLLRLDIGKVMNGIVGSSERQMRQVIQQAEATAPCILWIDEVEKALSGTKSSNFSDGGTMARVFGTLLTAMEEGLSGVTIFATANDISMLPPELIRRFSEVFFVDVPGPDERHQIFGIHLNKRGFNPEENSINITELVEASKNYTGHEIEKAVQRSVAFAWRDSEKKMRTEHVLQALTETKPISDIMGDKISDMRKEAHGKYRYASSWARDSFGLNKARVDKEALDDIELPEFTESNSEAADIDV